MGRGAGDVGSSRSSYGTIVDGLMGCAVVVVVPADSSGVGGLDTNTPVCKIISLTKK